MHKKWSRNVAYIDNDDDHVVDDDDQNALILKRQISNDLFVYCICLFMCLCMCLHMSTVANLACLPQN